MRNLKVALLMCTGIVAFTIVVGIPMYLGSIAQANQGITNPAGKMANVTKGGTTTFTNIERIPSYPGTIKEDSYCSEDVPDQCRYGLSATDSVEKVAAFYKNLFTQEGWNLTKEISGTSPTRDILDYVWKNPNQDAPTRRFASLRISSPGYRGSDTYIDLIFRPWPNPNKIPLYSDAQTVEVGWEEPPDEGPVRITKYVTNAEPSQVHDFYKEVLVKHGWTMGEVAYPNLSFGYHWGGPEESIGSGGEVHIDSSVKDGKTRVELRVAGEEVIPPGSDVKK